MHGRNRSGSARSSVKQAARLAEHNIEALVSAFDALCARPSERPSFQLLKAAASSAKWLMTEVLFKLGDDEASSPANGALLASIWLPTRTCSALLALHALSARRLATPGLSTAEAELHGTLCLSLSTLLADLLCASWMFTHVPQHEGESEAWSRQLDLKAASQQVADLAVRMDMLPACSALLSALVADPQRPLRSMALGHCLARLCYSFLAIAGSMHRWAEEDDEGLSSDGGDFHDSDACGALAAVASSGALEHAARALLRPPDRGHSASALRLLLVHLDWALADFNVLDGETHPGDHAEGCIRCSIVSSTRTILSSRCLQYALAAHVVSQLAAAGDGGGVYGLPQAELLPAQFAAAQEGGSGVPVLRGRRPPRRRLLEETGVLAAMRLWAWALLQRPPVPLVGVSRRAVHALSLRVLRLAVRSAAEHAAARRQAQRQQPGGGGSRGCGAAAGESTGAAGDEAAAVAASAAALPPLAALVPEEGCARLAFAALRCAALSARPRPLLYGTVPEAPYGNPARHAEGFAEFWGAAVPALHAFVEYPASRSWPPPTAGLDVDSLSVDIPAWPDAGLPPLPPPNLAAALAAGYLPLLERTLRVRAHSAAAATAAGSLDGVSARKAAETAAHLLPVLSSWPLLGRLLAYGPPHEAAALLATGGKLIRLLLPPGGAGGVAAGLEGSGEWWLSRPSRGELLKVADLPLLAMLRALGSCAAGQQPLPGAAQEAAGLAAPTRQLPYMLVQAARRWLPAAAAVAVALLRPHGGDGGGGAVGEDCIVAHLAVVGPIAQWVPALVQAHLLSRSAEAGAPPPAMAAAQHSSGVGGHLAAAAGHSGGGSGTAAVAADGTAACGWRQLLLVDMGLVGLLGAALGAALACVDSDTALHPPTPGPALTGAYSDGAASSDAGSVCSDASLDSDAEDFVLPAQAAEAVLPALASALACVAAAFPREVAAAARSGALRAPTAAHALRAEQRLSPAALAALRLIHESLAAGEGPVGPYDCTSGGGKGGASSSCSRALGAALLAAEQPPAEWPALRSCCNPGCLELGGNSEAALPLRACGGCGAVRYCSAPCQKAHWAQGHRQACGRSRG